MTDQDEVEIKNNLNVLTSKKLSFREVKVLTYTQFCLACMNRDKKNLLRKNIISGDVYIIRNAISRVMAKKILHDITNSNLLLVDLPLILEGVSNLYYESNNHRKQQGEYNAIDKSWYFFPWNPEQISLHKILQPIFNNVILLNNKDPSDVISRTPKDGFVQRFHLINYPIDSGEISLHKDPTDIIQVNSGLYLTQFGEDYHKGGFYVQDRNNLKVNIDEEVEVGDLILFFPGLPHGVSKVEFFDEVGNNKGRFFLNMSLVDSHHNKRRSKAIGLD